MRIPNFLKKYWPIVVILLLGIVPLTWFKENFLIAGGDQMSFLNPGNLFAELRYAWFSKINMGANNININSIFPYIIFWVVGSGLGLSLLVIQKIWLVLFFVLPGITMYSLVYYLRGQAEKHSARLSGFIAAIFYMFNMYVVFNVFQNHNRLIQIFLPLILLLWIISLKSKFSFKYPIIIGLVTIFYSSANVNAAITSLIPITLFCYWLYFIIIYRSRVKHALKILCSTIVFYLLINSWWLTVFLKGLNSLSGEVKIFFREAHFLSGAFMNEIVRFMGNWSFNGEYRGVPYFPYAGTYYQPFLLVLTYLLPILIFLILFFKLKNRNITFFALLAAVGLFLVKGVNMPFGSVYEWLYHYLPGFWVYRNPYSKFLLLYIFSAAVLLGFSGEFLFSKFKLILSWTRFNFIKRLSLIFPVVLVLVIFTTVFPIWSGEVINDLGFGMRSMHADVPDYWYEARDWFLENDPASRVLLVPPAGYGQVYDWSSGISGAGPVAQFILPNPLIQWPATSTHRADLLIKELYSLIDPVGPSVEKFSTMAGLLNIKYLLQQNDLAWYEGVMFRSASQEDVKKILTGQPGISYLRSFGDLDLYQIENSYLYAKIYPANKLVYSNGQLDSLGLVGLQAISKNPAIFFASEENQKMSLIKDGFNVYHIEASLAQPGSSEPEYFFEAPVSGNYNLFIYNATNKKIKGVILNNQLLSTSSPPESEFETRLWFQEFSGLTICSNGQIGAGFRYSIPFEVLPFKEGKDAVLVNGQIDQSLKWNKGFLDICLSDWPINESGVENNWQMAQNGKDIDLYRSVVKEYLYGYNTTADLEKFLLITKDGQVFEDVWGNVARTDEVEIGVKTPQSIVVAVPDGTVPEEGYRVFYCSEQLPELQDQYVIKFRRKSPFVSVSQAEFNNKQQKLKLDFEFLTDDHKIPEKIDLIIEKEINDVPVPQINFKKINTTKYKVEIKGATQGYYLTFLENFDPAWRAYINGRAVSEDNHFLVNGYANDWYIDKAGDYEVIIRYSIQRFLNLGWFISGVTLLFAIGYLWCKRKAGMSEINSLESRKPKRMSKKLIKTTRLLSNALLFLFIIMIILVMISMILDQQLAAEMLAIIGYLALVGGVLLKFIEELIFNYE